MLSASLFGDRSGIYDAFITAWRVPNLFRRFLGEGAIATAFQTTLTATEGDHGESAGRALYRRTFVVLAFVLVALCFGVAVAIPALPDRMPVTGWAWLGADPEPVRDLAVRVFPFVVFICLAALSTGALHVRGRFLAPALAPVALNVTWIAVLGIVASRFGASAGSGEDPLTRHLSMTHWLAWGVLLAGAMQLLVHLPALWRAGFLGRSASSSDTRADTRGGVRTVLRRSVPLALGAAVYQINVMVDGLMAEGMLPDGGPTLHYLANRVQQFPLALIAVAATSAVFPALQALAHEGDRQGLRDLHDRTHRAVAFFALPATCGLFVLAQPVVSFAFERGAFGAEGVERTSAALRMLTLAILPAGATGLVARTYYAMGDFTTPVRISSALLVVNVALNYILIHYVGMDVDGLALATTITSWLGFAALWPGLRGRLKLPSAREPLWGPLLRTSAVAIASALVASGAHRALADSGRGLALGVAIAAGAMSFLGMARAAGVSRGTRGVPRV